MRNAKRRHFLEAAGVLLIAPLGARAQQPEKLRRVGVLSLFPPASVKGWSAIEPALSKRGWTSDRVRFEYRFADNQWDRLPALAADLVRLGVDVIISDLGTTVAASRATSRIPIVMLFGLSEVEEGLTGSLGRPAKNITGLTGDVSAGVMSKRLELLREVVPQAKRIAFLTDPFPGNEVWIKNLENAAPRLGFAVQTVEVRAPGDLDAAFDAIRRNDADCLFCGGDPVTFPQRARITQFALEARLPGIHGVREFVEVGGLLSYGANLRETFAELLNYVDRILRGAAPRDLPIMRPTKYELVVNRKTAKALGITVPQSVLLRADEVIE